jgi:translation initiation factor IF-2
MTDQDGHSLSEAQPVTPVELQGFSGVPEAGEPFTVVDEEKVAKQIGTHRQARQRKEELAVSSTPVSLEDLMARMKGDEIRELNLIVKGDVQGSIEALKESLLNIPSSDIKVKVIHSGVGTVTESDIMLAAASEAIIIGFNVRPDIKTLQLGEEKHVDIRLYTVIYEAIEDVRKAMEGLLPPVEKEIIVGHAEVRDTFSVPKVGIIAGCHVTSGKIQRSNNVRLLRDSAVVFDGKISSMKRFKDDVKEAVEGYECGIGLHNFNDVKVGDVIEAYTVEQERAKLG